MRRFLEDSEPRNSKHQILKKRFQSEAQFILPPPDFKEVAAEDVAPRPPQELWVKKKQDRKAWLFFIISYFAITSIFTFKRNLKNYANACLLELSMGQNKKVKYQK